MSRVLVLTADEVSALLDVDALIDALAPAMADLSAGRASVPGRNSALVPQVNGRLFAMPGYVPSQNALVTKLVTLFPNNVATSLPTHQAAIMVFDSETGIPAALIDGTVITAIRTGACSALSARVLARENASNLAVLGTGVQARSHARAMVRVRPIREIQVAGRHPPRAQALARALQQDLDVEARAVGSYEEAVSGADIVCATTHPTEPVVRRAWLVPGTHVTSVGWSASGREVDDATVADALVCVETRQAALAPVSAAGSPDLTEPLRGGLIVEDKVVELGELIAGTRTGRTSPEQITLYKSVGVAVQDATAATLVLGAAHRARAGRDFSL